MNHINRSITNNEIEAAISKKSPETDGFIAEFYQTFKEEYQHSSNFSME
jgi:hypothetical protein